MFKLNTNIIGMGDSGLYAVNEIVESGLLGARTAVFCAQDSVGKSKAEYTFRSKYDFLEKADIFFAPTNTAVFVLVDCSSSVEVSLACEIAFITTRMGAFSVAVSLMPSSNTQEYSESLENLDELRSAFDGIVRFNEGYIDSFSKECVRFFEVLSRAMDSEAISVFDGFDNIKKLFERKKDVYFASVESKENMDSHEYNAKCLELRLCHQTYVDTANTLAFFYASGGGVNKKILDTYSNPIRKVNIAFMNDVRTYISDNNLELGSGEFVFAVMCAE